MSEPGHSRVGPVADSAEVRLPGLHPWRVVLRGPTGAIVGAGVLVDTWHVVTCAHVVSQALGTAPDGGAPTGELLAVLPFGITGNGVDPIPVQLRAQVHARGWAPASARGSGDLALLRLKEEAPTGYAVAQLSRARETGERRVLAFGHPVGLDDGVWVRTRVMGVAGPAGEWLQLDAAQVAGRSVTRGFSGAGAVDEATGEILGIVVAQDADAATRVAWMIRVETALTYLPYLKKLLTPSAVAELSPDSSDSAVTQASAAQRFIDPEAKQQLFQRLLAVDGMIERLSRDAYLRMLNGRLAISLSFPRHAMDRMDLWELAQALDCRPEALRDLIAVLRNVHPQASAVDALEEFVERAFPDLLLQRDERLRLETFLYGVSPAWVATAVSSATTGLGIPPATVPSSVEQAIRELEGYGRVRGGPAPPLLVFVDDLAHAIGGPTEVALHRWIDDVARRLEVSRVVVDALCQASGRRREERNALSLMVQLEPDRSDPDRYFLSALLMHHDRTERVLRRDDIARTLSEIAQELGDVLVAVPEGLGDQVQDPVIEFVLPRRLLGEPVEEWEFEFTGLTLPLGLRYPVVVRSLERIKESRPHADWRTKSRRLAETGHQANREALYCLAPEQQLPSESAGASCDSAKRAATDQRLAQAVYARLAGLDKAVCLAIPHPPDAGVSAASASFSAGLIAGFPVVLWARESVDPDQFFDLVRTTLADLPLETPQLVRRHRRAVFAGSERPTQGAVRVGVLFDLADRIPERFRRRPVRLQAPR